MNKTPQSQEFSLRAAASTDIVAIHNLLKGYSDRGNLLPRSVHDLETNLADFWVIELSGSVVACGALELFPNRLGEVRSLAVNETRTKAGLGSLLVNHLIEQARSRNLSRLMALTYAPEFFHRLGFRTVPKATLPEKVWGICVKCYKFYDCDEIAVLLYL
ncbi:MAG: N-acetyltransferase [Arenicellales bacterium]|nr:N-acetyltransferase [Arenicellales bacterium]